MDYLHVRFTPDEKKILETDVTAANCRTMSEYIRRLILANRRRLAKNESRRLLREGGY